jgi:hypothetical protein
MSNQNPLVKVDIDLTKPISILFEKISNAVGGLLKPPQIRRVAEAEAHAEKIRALARMDIEDEMQERALTRFFKEEAVKQFNIEAIAKKAASQLTEDTHPDQLDNDWIAHFFDRARLISDSDMQTLWAQVLAGQANLPGSYSKKAINVLSEMEQLDAITFSRLAQFVIVTEQARAYPIVLRLEDEVYKQYLVTFESLAQLESLGLILFNTAGRFELSDVPQDFLVYYFDSKIQLRFRQPMHNILNTGQVMFTRVGEELLQISDAKAIEGFAEYLVESWIRFGYEAELIREKGLQNNVGELRKNTPCYRDL